MGFKRRGEPLPIEDEREALRAQHAALEELKRQLVERVDAVRERELELHHVLADAGNTRTADPWPAAPLPPAPAPTLADADTGEDALEAERRERAYLEREQALAERETLLAERETLLAERERDLGLRAEQDRAAIAQREQELELRAEELAAAPPAPAATPEAAGVEAAAAAAAAAAASAVADAERLAQIEARLNELREAESLFLRTRDELAARSEAVAARERLVAQKERELDDREDGKGQWASPELTEMEARLRRLEQQQPGEQTMGFSGGLRKLGQGTRTPRSG